MDRKILICLALAVLILDRTFAIGSFPGWILKHTILFTGIPLLSILLLKIRPRDVGLSLGNWKLSVKYAAIVLALALPAMYYGSTLPDFRSYYPIWSHASDSIGRFLLYEAMIAVLMFNTEFFFRGYLLLSLRSVTGRNSAILLHAIPYMLVHIGKPALEVPYSFFVGLLFGYLALKTRSILPSFLIHFLGSVGFEIMVLYL